MPSPNRFGFDFSFNTSPDSAPRPRDPDQPLRFLVVADFSGRAARAVREPLLGRRAPRVDIDNLETVLAGFGAALPVRAGAAASEPLLVRMESLDDFHPDALCRNLAPLSPIVAAKRALGTGHAADAAARLSELVRAPAPSPATPQVGGTAGVPPAQPSPAPAAEADGDTLARLLGSPPAAAAQPTARSAGSLNVQGIIRDIVGTASRAPEAAAGTAGLTAAADLELTSRLRAILHDPVFQAVESAWRGLDFLVRRTPDEERVKFAALDVSLEEIAADPTGLVRLMRDGAANVLAVLTGTFGASAADLGVLGGLTRLCHALGVTLLAGAHPQVAGCDGFGAHPDPDDWKTTVPEDVRRVWEALRAMPEAARAWLASPRFVLRQPYGRAGDAIDSFAFEEMPADPAHESFLWGNPALLLAQGLAAAFAEGEGDGSVAAAGQVDGLPVARYISRDGTAIMPCAEAWLTDRAIARLHACGVSAIQSVRASDRVFVLPTPLGRVN